MDTTELGKILVGICSCCAYPDKRQAIRQTWLSAVQAGIECRFFLGSPPGGVAETDVVALDVPDDYQSLPGKVLAFFRYALENHDFDHLFKCDDDTYVALDRLGSVDRTGYDLVGTKHIARRRAPQGGAGYFLSRKMVETLARDRNLPSTGAEDVVVGRASLRHGATWKIEPNLRFRKTPYPRSENTVVTAHHLSPDHFRGIHSQLQGNLTQEIQIRHPKWSDAVLLYEDGWFSRKQGYDMGRWTFDTENRLHLDWLDWAKEIFVISENANSMETYYRLCQNRP